MFLSHVSISNYRGLRDVAIPLSKFGCLIGENNAGKSSSLQALSLFFSGTKLATSNFFDEAKPVRIAVTFENINESDLARLAEEHRGRWRSVIKNGRLTLVRLYDLDGKSALLYNTLTPTDPRFSAESIGALVKSQRAGAAFVAKVVQSFPELAGMLAPNMGQDEMKQKISELADTIPSEQKVAADQPIVSGIDKSIIPMLPEPIYIPAVKDLADDIKTAETTPFGKILAILLPKIEAKLPAAQKLFEELHAKLNRVDHADGTISDNRLDEIKSVEATVSKYVNESFANVSLRIAIPPPDMKTILSSAKIYANDGVEGLIDTKGDGLRRAIVFSILRSFVELKAKPQRTDEQVPDEAVVAADAAGIPAEVGPDRDFHLSAEDRNPAIVASPPSYILMFEEPELFLHPKAQHILFDALRVFALEHQVLVTTHSPMFLGPGATDSFVKLRKVTDSAIAQKPFTKVQTVDVSMLSAKDQFQIICFENNNAAFFASTVVLVEGDSDYLLMPHIAKTLNPLWDVARTPVLFVRISGKGNIRRYREFFKNFDVRVPVIADLDFLVQGFEHIAHDEPMRILRDQLLVRVDSLIEADTNGASNKEAKDARDSGELKGLWKAVKQRTAELREGNCTPEELDAAVERFYAWQRKTDRNSVLKNSTDWQMIRDKHQLLEMLRAVDVFVLERGAIEEYYPSSITGADKPSKAQDFCAKVATANAAKECCGTQDFERGGVPMSENEFTLIFGGIFS